MKIQLIMLNEPILVSDEQPVKGYYFDFLINKIRNTGGAEYAVNSITKPIIAGLQELPKIDFSNLSEEECKRIGWVDVNKIFEDLYSVPLNDNSKRRCEGFIEGFKTALSINEKKFSEEDIRKALRELGDVLFNNNCIQEREPEEYFDSIIQSLSQPKSFEVEVEMDRLRFPKGDDGWEDVYSPKIINDSIKITKVI